MLTMKTSYISHVLMLKLKCVSRDRRMSGNLLNGEFGIIFLNALFSSIESLIDAPKAIAFLKSKRKINLKKIVVSKLLLDRQTLLL